MYYVNRATVTPGLLRVFLPLRTPPPYALVTESGEYVKKMITTW